mmetsp:Transcript_3649/g.13089  ORF Transcript_3649/g.13089 Transcript_3649/m.13089 type:complete len:213 (-) Transcript_3649:1286-1924(-)
MEHHGDLPAHHVVEPPVGVVVHEAVAHPEAGADGLAHLVEELEGLLDALLVQLAPLGQRVRHGLRVVAQDVEAVLRGDDHQLARLGPEDVLAGHVDAPQHAALRPVVEAYEVLRAHAQQRAAVQPLRVEVGPDLPLLLEVAEHLDLARRLARRELVVHRPGYVQGGAEALVPPRQRSVHDVLAVAAHRNEAPVGVVLEDLRVQVAAAQLLDR